MNGWARGHPFENRHHSVGVFEELWPKKGGMKRARKTHGV